MTSSAIIATGLRKAYGDHLVLDGIDVDVPSGTVFALLGPNGAGKTTTVRILSHSCRQTPARCPWPATTWPRPPTASGPLSG